MKKFYLAICVCLALNVLGCVSQNPASVRAGEHVVSLEREQAVYTPYIRIRILEDVKVVNIGTGFTYNILAGNKKGVFGKGGWFTTTAQRAPIGIKLQGKTYFTTQIDLIPQDIKNSQIKINDRFYRGIIRFIKTTKDKMSVINIVDIEPYLYGVLFNEISHEWPIAAIKAQAVCSRTYAVYMKSVNKDNIFDVTADIYSQVYSGSTNEKQRIIEAVDQTKGEILTYNNEIFPPFFHATCAGRTEDADQLWKINIPPLKSKRCLFCVDSPHYHWNLFLSYPQLESMLKEKRIILPGIHTIRINKRNASGRVKTIFIGFKNGEAELPAKDFRLYIGPNLLKSTLFIIHPTNEGVLFKGRGWGHGVGMCQWGAFGMAKKGYTARQILNYYFPGSKIEKKW